LLGLGYANHMAGFLPAPAVAFAVMVRRPQTILRWKLLLVAVAAVLFGMTPFATQPIRAAYFPAINEGEPTACRTEIAVSCTFSGFMSPVASILIRAGVPVSGKMVMVTVASSRQGMATALRVGSTCSPRRARPGSSR